MPCVVAEIATPEPRVPIPIVWVEGVASLDDRDPPSDVPRHRWRLFVDDCKRFVASDWAGRAAQLGWNAMSLFGCAPKRPLDYSGSGPSTIPVVPASYGRSTAAGSFSSIATGQLSTSQ